MGKPLAVDFVITERTTTDVPDQIAHNKSLRYTGMCEADGLKFLPCVGDSFGTVCSEHQSKTKCVQVFNQFNVFTRGSGEVVRPQ